MTKKYELLATHFRMLYYKFKVGLRNIISNNKIVLDDGNLELGKNITLGENCVINCFDMICLGDNLLTSDNVNFIKNTHNYTDINKPINQSGGGKAPITIKEDCWIGINVTILGGIIIGKHCVVGANS